MRKAARALVEGSSMRERPDHLGPENVLPCLSQFPGLEILWGVVHRRRKERSEESDTRAEIDQITGNQKMRRNG